MTEDAKTIGIFCHRGFYGVTDVGPQSADDAKGPALKNLPPENSEESIEMAFKNGFPIETDVTTTCDGHIIVTHANDLALHNAEAKKAKKDRKNRKVIGETPKEYDNYISKKSFEVIQKLQTGLGGRTAPFLTYERFMALMRKYPLAFANIEIKGTIQDDSIKTSEHPSLIDRLIEETPPELQARIVWSSFSKSNIVKMREKVPKADIALLFAEPERLDANEGKEDLVYPDTEDRYLQFNVKNVEEMDRQGIKAVHPCIDSLMSSEGEKAVGYCAAHGMTLRTWAQREKKPNAASEKAQEAKALIVNVLNLKKQYPTLHIDIITDYPKDVQDIINT
jgi:glycerophosphoryl diester phosphodiesterase